MRILATGASLVVAERRFDPRQTATPHTHEAEHLVYVLAGEAHLVLDGRTRVVQAGECYVVPAGTPHSLETPAGATILELASR